MKVSILLVGITLLFTVSVSYGGPVSDRFQRPCFRVSIQNDRINDSNVRQNCDRNFNRTVQAGSRNRAKTIQTGGANDNKVRQYHFDTSRYLERMRRR